LPNAITPNNAAKMILGRLADRLSLFNGGHLIFLLIGVLSLHGCASIRDVLDNLPVQRYQAEMIERNDFTVAREDDVMGRLAMVRIEKDDTLPDIARHFSLGINTVSAANPGIDIWVPETGEYVLLPMSFILPDTQREGIVINLAAMRLFSFHGNGNPLAVSTYPVGIGTTERPTPRGQMHVTHKKVRPTWYVPASIAEDHRKKEDPLPPKVPPGPLNPLGDHALYLSRPEYLVHGTNKPASIGLRATNGCIRLYPEDIKRLFENTPVDTPVNIIYQPYLVGHRDGIVYMEVHPPFDESDPTALNKAYAKLRNIEKTSAHTLDWQKVETEIAKARGIPVPISRISNRRANDVAATIELNHPGNLYGKPEIPELKTDAWYVLAANLREKVDAQRLAAIINHQGPQIPARVLSEDDHHRVLAGPFNGMSEASDAVKRLKIDLEIEGILIEP